MKRPRPYIPIAVRVEVAERQVKALCDASIIPSIWWPLYESASETMTIGNRLLTLLLRMSDVVGGAKFELDHFPALILRDFKVDRRKPPAAWYSPNANDPEFLLYRPSDAHQHKTTGRKPGAERTITTKGSDVGLKTKFARLEKKDERKRTKNKENTLADWDRIINRPKAKIPSRPFSTQKRKFR